KHMKNASKRTSTPQTGKTQSSIKAFFTPDNVCNPKPTSKPAALDSSRSKKTVDNTVEDTRTCPNDSQDIRLENIKIKEEMEVDVPEKKKQLKRLKQKRKTIVLSEDEDGDDGMQEFHGASNDQLNQKKKQKVFSDSNSVTTSPEVMDVDNPATPRKYTFRKKQPRSFKSRITDYRNMLSESENESEDLNRDDDEYQDDSGDSPPTTPSSSPVKSSPPSSSKKGKSAVTAAGHTAKRSNTSTDSISTLSSTNNDSRLQNFAFSKNSSSPTKTTSSPPTTSTAVLSPQDRKKERQKQRQTDFKSKNEERYAWLLNVRDAEGNPENSPNYDSRTLYIPPDAWKKFTPFEKQFWEIKGTHWDTVVFFKKGKFYELYEKDADIGHKEFDLKLTDRVNMRMVGIPEMSFEHWAGKFIAAGYKVAKVDQMETALAKEMREKSNKPSSKSASSQPEKIIRRELTTILTAGTLVDPSMLSTPHSTYCMSIKEYFSSADSCPTFGIVFVDTSTASFHFSSFTDDADRSQFETLIVQVKPKEIVFEKGLLSPKSMKVLKNCLDEPILNGIKSGTEFWNAEDTIRELTIGQYFKKTVDEREGTRSNDAAESNETDELPPILTASKTSPHLLSALGGLTYYLRTLQLERALLSLANFSYYTPLHPSYLLLDSRTLSNLEVFTNSYDGSTAGTLFELIDHCTTAFGKRTLRKWTCQPLWKIEEIKERQDGVEVFIREHELRTWVESWGRELTDLERIISRVHARGCKVGEFVGMLESFENVVNSLHVLTTPSYQSKICSSSRLLYLVSSMPDLRSKLEYFRSVFEYKDAKANGFITPRDGAYDDYDESRNKVRSIEEELERYRMTVSKKLGVTAKYKDVGKEIYQLEVPGSVKVPGEWTKLTSTKVVNRYWTPHLQKLIRELQESREIQSSVLRLVRDRLYEKFDASYTEWLQAVKIVAEIDCLVSLAKCSLALGATRCMPQFVEADKNFIKFEDLRHPCITPRIANDFIPNNISLGSDEPNMILLTGPNMGGKSTLLRQTCVAIIMAQLGCYVPASSCTLTPFDRIFTRIGANDRILSGQSTFMVESIETAKILNEATHRSMVILDELGRGTSTHDGYAIAYSVLTHLVRETKCVGLFSTHYVRLTDEFKSDRAVKLMHMQCEVNEEERRVTFLYKLINGVCPRSYGLNVARMAGVPEVVVSRAEEIAEEFEKKCQIGQ
ncbi:8999_t:CDS:2, partial [Paraglomus occultum]